MNQEDSPISPVYPFNEPGQPVLLHDGLIGGLGAAEVPGIVELSCSAGFSLDWEVGPGAQPGIGNRDEVHLVLRRPQGDMSMEGVARDINGGWSNGAEFGSPKADLARIVVHWFNLPNWHGPHRLVSKVASGGELKWSGRWVHESNGWKVTLDVRHDHQRVWKDLHKSDVYVMTHVMELRRIDGANFTAAEADPVLTAMHVGVSFALGRWAAPMFPVGQNSDHQVVWEQVCPGP
ncbi:hypothetical protein OG453_15125 [Streptomyces sp. NBC_01381]|uniref:hypothetical protein n=1 Tax=Streptomyces sp. NBC_01381 TaxID=2903845 RepID=UPI00225855B0|nr:hypothetical protein [Streptomyces sp. NBC_01381]MCX4667988.1 hypothetical protein [Streptomyces sp. NBC_01381]